MNRPKGIAPMGSALRKSALRRTVVAAGLVLATFCAFPQRLAAVSGSLHTGSNPQLRLTADAAWPDGSGYRPVRIKATPTTQLPDVSLRVEFEVYGTPGYRDADRLTVVQYIEIPAGSGPVEAVMSVPEYFGWQGHKMDVYVNGVRSPSLSTNGRINLQNYNGWVNEGIPALLVVGKKLPDTAALAAHLPLDEYYQSRSQGGPATPRDQRQWPNALVVPPAELPGGWINYSGLDLIFLSVGDLVELRDANPSALEALRRWTAAGGNLCVTGAGADWSRLPVLEKSLDLPASDQHGKSGTVARGWQKPPADLFGKPVPRLIPDRYNPYAQWSSDTVDAGGKSADEAIPPEIEHGQPPDAPPFLLRPYDMGLVVAIAADDPFPGRAGQWAWMFNAMGIDRRYWHCRHGLSVHHPNPDYWDFLIPGIGLAPVTEFCVLITIFVIAIGPVNYWLLRRWRRLYLLVVTIPAGAAAVTLALLVYAIVSDGLGTRVRSRSVTWIDQGRGRAVCWSRLSYYCGLTPRGGLRFPADVAVLPLEENPPANPWGDEPRDLHELYWDGDQQLRQGWIRSRTPAQYLTIRSRASDAGLGWSGSKVAGTLRVPSAEAEPGTADGTRRMPATSSPPQVENRLGTRILQLLVCSPNGSVYWGEGIEVGDTASLTPIAEQEGRLRLARTHAAHRPQRPPDMDDAPDAFLGLTGRRYRYGYGYGGGGQAAAPSCATSRMERVLAQLGDVNRPLTPGSYVAVVERSPEVVLGVSSAREEAGYHVVFGTW
jgi:hypothetical protein